MRFRTLVFALAAAALPAGAQQTLPGPNVGDVAPAFSAKGATKDGVLAAPITLESLKGKTVVLAFFPRARTSGCTVQMETYRDRYAELFNGGKDVVLLGVSTDSDATLASWAKDAKFPFTFLSDDTGAIGKAYGTLDAPGGFAKRYLYVIDPQGRVSFVQKPVNVMAPAQYTAVGTAVKQAMSVRGSY
jgi:thioredoxin-dependent peroxiredoxin